MKWLLLILVFDISGERLSIVDQDSKVFTTKAACDKEGERLGRTVDYPGKNLRSMSICIPESAYEE